MSEQPQARTESQLRSSIDALLSAEPEPSEDHQEPEVIEPEKDLIDAELDAIDESHLEEQEPGGDDDEPSQEQGLVEDSGLDTAQLAEKLGVDPSELYDIKFKYGTGGESMTLGELKDLGSKSVSLTADIEKYETQKEDFINDQMKSRTEINSLISILPNVTPQLMAEAKQQHGIAVRRERSALLQTLPEWNDSEVEKQAMTAIRENMSSYGFKAIELDHMLDHRLVKVLHDYTRMRNKIRAPQAEISKMRKSAKGKGTPKTSAQKSEQKQARVRAIGKTDTRGAINELFRE